MKFALRAIAHLLLVALFALPAHAQNGASYYISPAGDDASPGTQSQPWRTLARVQAAFADLSAGTQFLFERGGVYTGSLTLNERGRGTADAPVVFGAYGTGDTPILSALFPLTDWVNIGENRWQTRCVECAPRTDLLLIDRQAQPKARYPNLDGADEGYLYFDDFRGREALIDDALRGSTNWSGGELVIRSIAWVLDRYPITAHEGDTLQLGTALDDTAYDFEVGYGYFLQNHPAALDRDGEWVHDAAAQTITLYLGDNPNTRLIQTTAVNDLFYMEFVKHIRLSDLALEGGAAHSLHLYVSEDITLERLDIRYSAAKGIQATAIERLNMSDTHIAHHLSNGFSSWGCNNCNLHHNLIEQIGLLAGMGLGGDGAYNGADLIDSVALFEYNTIQYVGYNGLGMIGNVTARYNLIQHFALVKVDSGGIGTYQTSGVEIIGNIVLYGLGSDAAIPWSIPAVNGIYIDDNSQDIEVRDNVVGFVGGNGIVLHNTQNVRVMNNIVFDAGQSGIFINDDRLGDLRATDSRINNNQVFTLSPDSPPLRALTELEGASWLAELGSLKGNMYCNPARSEVVVATYQPEWFTQAFMLSDWQAVTGNDECSAICDVRAEGARLEVNPTDTPLTITLDGFAYRALNGISYPPNSAVTLAPHSGMILVRE
jgi:parallel beta-helix repeat protein